MRIVPETTVPRLTGVLQRIRGWSNRPGTTRSADQTFRPRLADNVRLVGRMSESAFAVEPWLVERNGRFIQLTELLYRVAELADGQRSIPHIADEASRATGSNVSPQLVWKLVESKLAPIGIIAADPHLPSSLNSAVRATRTPASPMALNMRMAVISPRLINMLTVWLQYLYAPPVLVGLLFVAIQAQYWLLFVHGAAPGMYDALDRPVVVPLVFGLVIASAAFHELGHAAALRYGGRQVRGMGVGLYLVYPAFYTDVTENYGLARWPRVRTDLGGFYFNVLFSLGLMGVYHFTGHEFLLLVALLTDIEIIHQCLPFVRLDGYWALADITGIPDFFSLMGAYLRSILPVSAWRGSRLPRLKWWAKAVFGLYILITVPVLGALLFVTLRAAPRILSTAHSVAQQKLADVTQAQAAGDALSMAGAEVEMLLLLLPAIGVAVLLFTLGQRLAMGLWRWGRPTRGRRVASVAVAAVAGAVLLLLWFPGLAAPAANYMRVVESLRTPREASAAAVPEATLDAAPPTIAPTVAPTDAPQAPTEVPSPAATPSELAQPAQAAEPTTVPPPTPFSAPGGVAAPTRAAVVAASAPRAAPPPPVRTPAAAAPTSTVAVATEPPATTEPSDVTEAPTNAPTMRPTAMMTPAIAATRAPTASPPATATAVPAATTPPIARSTNTPAPSASPAVSPPPSPATR